MIVAFRFAKVASYSDTFAEQDTREGEAAAKPHMASLVDRYRTPLTVQALSE